MQLHLHAIDLPLKHTFRISHESRDIMPTLIVELRDDTLSGFGEATETRYYGIYRQELIDFFATHREQIENTPLHDPAQYMAALDAMLGERAFARCALDVAAHDLWARRQGQRLGLLWEQDHERRIPTCFTIGLGSIEEMVAKMQEQPWPIYKIKLGTDHDLDIIRALRQHTTATFRVDANTAWSPEQTVQLAPQLRDLGVEFIEQPLKAGDWDGQAFVYQNSPLPIIADESCHTEADVLKCAGYFHGINIKLMKCGGLLPARRMIAQAHELGMQVMVGCMTESSVGISAIAQLVPELDYVDMDGALLLRDDPADGVRIDTEGIVHYPDRAGTGVVLKKPVA